MACFIVPATEAVVTTIIEKRAKKRESKSEINNEKIPLSKKLSVLNGMLWGGSGLLAFEHLWHGEITPFFPFLTNASSPESAMEMLYEMATVGTSMSLFVTAVWGVIMFIAEKSYKKDLVIPSAEESV